MTSSGHAGSGGEAPSKVIDLKDTDRVTITGPAQVKLKPGHRHAFKVLEPASARVRLDVRQAGRVVSQTVSSRWTIASPGFEGEVYETLDVHAQFDTRWTLYIIL